jgi:hypothetical protein
MFTFGCVVLLVLLGGLAGFCGGGVACGKCGPLDGVVVRFPGKHKGNQGAQQK